MGHGRAGTARTGQERFGAAGHGRHGTDRRGKVRWGKAGVARIGGAWWSEAGVDGSSRDRLGKAG